MSDFEYPTVREMRQMAKLRGKTNWGSMIRADLIAFLYTSDNKLRMTSSGRSRSRSAPAKYPNVKTMREMARDRDGYYPNMNKASLIAFLYTDKKVSSSRKKVSSSRNIVSSRSPSRSPSRTRSGSGSTQKASSSRSASGQFQRIRSGSAKKASVGRAASSKKASARRSVSRKKATRKNYYRFTIPGEAPGRTW